MARAFLILCLLPVCLAAAQPSGGESYPLAQVRPGQKGEVWTVFQGTNPEPFAVEVAGIIQNALGPGKSIILCKLTDPRVQDMGAVAGMSGSPLYIEGRFAGALSYQMQRFETVRYAGFTPAADMEEVEGRIPAQQSPAQPGPEPATPAASDTTLPLRPMTPVFALGGVSPAAAAVMIPRLESLGIGVVTLAGTASGSPEGAPPAALRPGDAVSVALATGDITLAGTGTVSRVDGNRIVAFGHPMIGMGDVQFPMCSADVVAILPSTLESVKIANIGPVIGCISQDRLSAVSGVLGQGPEMTEVEVDTVRRGGAPGRTIRFQVVRDIHIAPSIMATGILEAVSGSNESESDEGFRVLSTVGFSGSEQITRDSVYAGQQGFVQGLFEFLITLSAELQNPFEKALPRKVSFRVEPLDANPSVTIEQFQVSRTAVRPGEPLQATISWRDYQGAEGTSTVDIPVDPSWTGKTLEIIAAPGRLLDEVTGHSRIFRPGQIRSFGAYLDALRDERPEDGVCIAVVERSALFFDEAAATADAPASIERIAAESDSARYQRRDALVPLWEAHVLPGKVSFADFHRTVRVVE